MKKTILIITILISSLLNINIVQAEKTIPNGTYTINSLLNKNKTIDLKTGKATNGNNIQLWDSNNTNAQRWMIEYQEDDYYIFRSSINNNKCIETKNNNIELNECTNQNNQKFNIIKINNNYFSIIPKDNSNLAVDISEANTTNGTNIQLWESNNTNAQKWTFSEIIELKQTIYNGTYTINSLIDNNKVIDVADGSTANGTNIQLWTSNNTNAQKWIVTYLNNGYYNIKSKLDDSKCLEVKNSNYSIFSNIQLSACNNQDNQKFIIKELANKQYSIVTKINHLYLDVANGSNTNKANIQLYNNNDTNAQKWKLNFIAETSKSIEDGTYIINSQLDENKAIDVSNGTTINGTNIQLYENNNTDAQKWIIKYLNNGFYNIKSKLDDSKCLEIKDNKYINNTNIELNECNNEDNQLFSIKNTYNGYFIITAKYNNMNIDLSNGKKTNGTNIQLLKNNNSSAQKWKFLESIESTETIETGDYILNSSLDNNKNIDVTGGKTTDGTNIQIWESNNTKAQKWFIEFKNGYYQFKSKLNKNKCLEVKNSNFSILSNIQLSTCNNKDNQQFIIKKIDDEYYSIITKINHLYIDIANGKTNNGTNVQLYFNNGTNAQKWKINSLNKKDIETGTYIINTSLNKNQTLDVSSAKSFENTNIQIYESNNTNAQKWFIEKQNDKSYTIKTGLNSSLYLSYKDNNIIISETEVKWEIEFVEKEKYNIKLKNQDLYLNVEDTSAINGTNINLTSNNNSTSQLFEFNETEVDENINTITTSNYIIETKLKKLKNIDVDGGKKSNGTNIHLWENNSTNAQIWKVNYINNGIYQILSAINTNLTLNINNNIINPKSNINLWKNNNTNNQKWKLIDDKNGYISIKNINSNLCISVANNNADNNTNIELDTCNNNDNQKFKLKRYTDKKIYKGIDISQYQGNINWEQTADNIDFAIIRAGYGDNWTNQDDKKFIRNVEECEKYNIPYGIYLYSYAKKVQKDNNDANLNYNAESAVSEAAHVLRLLNSVNYKPNLKTAVYLDMEEDSLGTSLGKDTLTNITNKFCSIIKSNGYGCGVYANRNWLKKYLDINNIIKNYNLWLAEWIETTNYNTAQNTETNYQTTSYTLWQFSDKGTISGITGDVDLDIGYDIFD